MHTPGDTAGQILQSFEEVGFSLDEGRGGDQFLGLRDG
jgi:hypothetical protein